MLPSKGIEQPLSMEKQKLLEHLAAQGFTSNICNAFKKVPREDFIPEQFKSYTYKDTALPLNEENATISQPTTIAFMLSLLELPRKKKQKILEIGSGSGYVLALLAEVTNSNIYGIEINKNLATRASSILANYKNIHIINKNGVHGLPEKAPFDRILLSAAAESVPEHLIPQLKENGILVAPVNTSIIQLKKHKKSIEMHEFPGFIFVSLQK